jgi:hypothetical protein
MADSIGRSVDTLVAPGKANIQRMGTLGLELEVLASASLVASTLLASALLE